MTDDEAVAHWAEHFRQHPPEPLSPAKLLAVRNLLGPIKLPAQPAAAKAA